MGSRDGSKHGTWPLAPLVAAEEVEILDRYNGVPTLGVFRGSGKAHMFWRAAGYTGDVSLWLDVPLTPEDEHNVDDDDGPGFLDGIVFQSPRTRFATVWVANLNRPVFKREWNIPAVQNQAQILRSLLEFAFEALTLVLGEDLPTSRRAVYQKAKTAVRQLVI